MVIATPTRDSLAVAERAVDAAIAKGATQAEAVVIQSDQALTRFANSEIHQNVAERDSIVNLRFVDGQRVGVASTNRLDDEALVRLAATAVEICHLQPERPDFAGLPGPAPITPVASAWSRSTAEASPEDRADRVRAVIGAADAAGVVAYGSFTTSSEEVAVANSLGTRAAEERSLAHLIVVTMGENGGSGYAESAAVDQTTLDPGAIGREAASKAVSSRGAVAIDAGEYPVVLEEYAVVDLLDMLGYLGFSALAVQEDRSFYEAGRRIGSDLVTLYDDATDPAGTPASFDYEGVPKQKLTLLDRGVCRDLAFDSDTAAKAGRTSTGHGLPAPNPYGPFPLNQVMQPGSASRDELIAGLDRGLLVTRFHYTNPVHPKLAMVTGMTRDGLFLVAGGKITGPVRNLRFTQSYLAACAGIVAVASERRLLRGLLGSVVVPAVRISGFTFTGVTEH